MAYCFSTTFADTSVLHLSVWSSDNCGLSLHLCMDQELLLYFLVSIGVCVRRLEKKKRYTVHHAFG
eukprot:COSAG02_NODE_2513_length_8624_cov_15.389443_9_plen_66_part_00